MDLFIQLTDGKIITDLYCKYADSHEFLHYHLCHPKNIEKLIAFSPTVWLTGVCSRKNDLDSHVKEIKNWFRERGYLEEILVSKLIGL